MTKYKGYYIDHVVFNSKDEIDAFVKAQAVEGYKAAYKRFTAKPNMETSAYCSKLADRLHKVFGLSYAEIEEIEISAA